MPETNTLSRWKRGKGIIPDNAGQVAAWIAEQNKEEDLSTEDQ